MQIRSKTSRGYPFYFFPFFALLNYLGLELLLVHAAYSKILMIKVPLSRFPGYMSFSAVDLLMIPIKQLISHQKK